MCPPFRKAAAEGYSEKFGFLMIELSDKINRSGRFNVFQTNLENKLLNGFKLLNSFTFIHISNVLESRRNSRDTARPKI